ncbi:MAG: hypothetical protein VW684_11060 [Betaproteobacteria bacterium]|jgi:hypothetical protein
MTAEVEGLGHEETCRHGDTIQVLADETILYDVGDSGVTFLVASK